ncbi:uncharacterized protein CLUP02_06291 [Colletotrichum lupini]|uniref:Uncharacterized protein n=1 Tax=Colletotrichum lupini TaxID=145971 RepID=A0A9Q8SNX9_9PEZI|nr:uncharacterized protein CLUP02_06291 [Colletotrichum lupini]UQC80806.1 hypothetical protein CLUP02_06291 [Colletotrichum lupini]
MPSQGPRAGGEKVPPSLPSTGLIVSCFKVEPKPHGATRAQQAHLAHAPQLGRCNFQAARNSIYWQKGPKLSQPSRPSRRYKQRAHDRSAHFSPRSSCQLPGPIAEIGRERKRLDITTERPQPYDLQVTFQHLAGTSFIALLSGDDLRDLRRVFSVSSATIA